MTQRGWSDAGVFDAVRELSAFAKRTPEQKTNGIENPMRLSGSDGSRTASEWYAERRGFDFIEGPHESEVLGGTGSRRGAHNRLQLC